MSPSLVENTQDSILIDLYSHTQQRLALLLQRMFDQLDDVLFELADQSRNYAQQNLYFESMRDIRIKRRLIEQTFAQTIEGFFHTLVDESAPFDLTQKQSVLLSVEAEDGDQQMAFTSSDDKLMVDAMIANALAYYPLALAQLTARLDSLMPAKLESKQNPIGPHLITQAFFFASRHLKISAKAKSIYFTAFDRCVLNSLGDVTTLCNTILFEQGVLPHLLVDHTHESTSVPHYSQDSPLESAISVEQLLKDSVDSVDSASTQASQIEFPQYDAKNAGVLSVIRPLGQGKILAREAIVNALCEIQRYQYQEWRSLLSREGMDSLPCINDIDIIQLVDSALAAEDAYTYVSIDTLDAELINLVKMLFQFVLEDDNLSPSIKSVITCLYVPIIKVSLLDTSFFSQAGHPARQLLNEVSTAALGWNPVPIDQRDPLIQEVLEIIHAILTRFDQDVAIFQQSLDGFKTFLEIDSRNTSLLEQRLVDAEGGKAKSESTRYKIQRLIDSTLEMTPAPEVIERFLRSVWSNVLFVNRLKHGKESAEFTGVVEVMDRLLWSVRPADMFESRQELMSALPALLKNLREKLTEIDVNTLDQTHFFAELEAIHLNRIKSATPETETKVTEEAKATEETKVAEKTKIVEIATAKLEPEQNEPEQTAQIKNSDQAVESHEIEQQTHQSTSTELDNHSAESDNLDEASPEVNKAILDQVNAIVVGGWVDFTEGDQRIRCRLAAKIKHTGMFLFVNRRGQKMAEYTADQLAQLVQKNQVNILDDGLLFDRALESVIGGLRR